MSEWQPIETAPAETCVKVRLESGGTLLASLHFGNVENKDGMCWAWQTECEDDCPDSWTDGYCWAVNEDGVPSDQPTHWMPPPTHQQG